VFPKKAFLRDMPKSLLVAHSVIADLDFGFLNMAMDDRADDQALAKFMRTAAHVINTAAKTMDLLLPVEGEFAAAATTLPELDNESVHPEDRLSSSWHSLKLFLYTTTAFLWTAINSSKGLDPEMTEEMLALLDVGTLADLGNQRPLPVLSERDKKVMHCHLRQEFWRAVMNRRSTGYSLPGDEEPATDEERQAELKRIGVPGLLRDTLTEARDSWLYGLAMKRTKWMAIVGRLKKKCETSPWEQIDSVPVIKAAVKRYAIRHHLALPEPRQSGRPTGKKPKRL
jgi:hypothetical protein